MKNDYFQVAIPDKEVSTLQNQNERISTERNQTSPSPTTVLTSYRLYISSQCKSFGESGIARHASEQCRAARSRTSVGKRKVKWATTEIASNNQVFAALILLCMIFYMTLLQHNHVHKSRVATCVFVDAYIFSVDLFTCYVPQSY